MEGKGVVPLSVGLGILIQGILLVIFSQNNNPQVMLLFKWLGYMFIGTSLIMLAVWSVILLKKDKSNRI